VNFDFHRLVRPINVSQLLLFIDYMDYIDWFPVIDFHQFGTPGKFRFCHYSCTLWQALIQEVENVRFNEMFDT